MLFQFFAWCSIKKALKTFALSTFCMVFNQKSFKTCAFSTFRWLSGTMGHSDRAGEPIVLENHRKVDKTHVSKAFLKKTMQKVEKAYVFKAFLLDHHAKS